MTDTSGRHGQISHSQELACWPDPTVARIWPCGARYLRMIDLLKHESRSLDKINTREAGSRVLTNEQSIGALTSPDSCVPTLLNNYTTLIICEVALQKRLRDGGREKRKSKSPKCNFTTADGGIGTVDGAAWLGSASS